MRTNALSSPVMRTAVALCLVASAAVVAAADGAEVYKARCAICHGDAPAPKFVGKTEEDVKSAIANGKGKMRPVQLDAAEAAAVATFTAGGPR